MGLVTLEHPLEGEPEDVVAASDVAFEGFGQKDKTTSVNDCGPHLGQTHLDWQEVNVRHVTLLVLVMDGCGNIQLHKRLETKKIGGALVRDIPERYVKALCVGVWVCVCL